MKTINNTVNNVFLKKSANGTGIFGLHQQNSWLDKSVQLFQGDFSVQCPDDDFIVTHGTTDYIIASEVILGAALFEGIQGKGESLETLLGLYQAGFVSKAQQRFFESGKIASTDTNTPFDKIGKLISAEQYLRGEIVRGLDIANYDTVRDIVLQAYAKELDKLTKVELVTMLSELVQVFLSNDHYGTYERKLLSEEEAAKKFKTLVVSGYTDIVPMTDGRYSAKLAMTKLSNIGLLADNGFILVGTVPLPDGNFQINFKDIAEQN